MVSGSGAILRIRTTEANLAADSSNFYVSPPRSSELCVEGEAAGWLSMAVAAGTTTDYEFSAVGIKGNRLRGSRSLFSSWPWTPLTTIWLPPPQHTTLTTAAKRLSCVCFYVSPLQPSELCVSGEAAGWSSMAAAAGTRSDYDFSAVGREDSQYISGGTK